MEGAKPEDFPGPGSYNGDNKPGVILGIIHPVHGRDPSAPFTPGPGEYNAGDLSVTMDSSPARSFAKSKRDFLNVSDPNLSNPGPGHYNGVPPQTSISFTIG